jgi:hypothetical protein
MPSTLDIQKFKIKVEYEYTVIRPSQAPASSSSAVEKIDLIRAPLSFAPGQQRKKCLLALLYPHTLSSSFDQSIVKSNGFYDSLHQSYSSQVSVGCSRRAAVVYSQFWVSSASSLCTTSRSE